jgi:nitroimidazol reductase NimA-like FMN-containing flavoprotein (pyridoxamine 5'-phosphate oxidase superfamily)
MFELTEQQCRESLAKHAPRLGRVAFAEDGDPNWPSILPVNYAYYDGRVFIRTFEGSKLYAALRRQRIAFEIDMVDEDWKQGWSVVALGTLELVTDPEQRTAVGDVLNSWAADDTNHLVRLDIEQMTGREILAGPSSNAG